MRPHLGLVLGAGVLIGSSLLAQGFNLRTGTWEFTMQMGGALSTEGVPPELRAQIEAELRKPQTYKSCITAEDVKNLRLGRRDDSDAEDCKTVSSKVAGTTADFVQQCEGDEPRTETAHFEAASPQALRANISMKSPRGTSTIALTGKWLAAQCTD